MDRIVWNSEIAGDFTDGLRRALNHLDDDEAMLKRVCSELEIFRSVSGSDTIGQILTLLDKVKGNLELLIQRTSDTRSGIYRSIELFDNAENHIIGKAGSGTDSVKQAQTAIIRENGTKQAGTTVFIYATASRVNPDWLSDLASGMHQTIRRS